MTELDNLVPEPEEHAAAAFDWPRLLLAGSILARSDQRAHQEAALRIATAAVTLVGAATPVKDAGAVLSRQAVQLPRSRAGERARPAHRRSRRPTRHGATHRGSAPSDGPGDPGRIEWALAPGQRLPTAFLESGRRSPLALRVRSDRIRQDVPRAPMADRPDAIERDARRRLPGADARARFRDREQPTSRCSEAAAA